MGSGGKTKTQEIGENIGESGFLCAFICVASYDPPRSQVTDTTTPFKRSLRFPSTLLKSSGPTHRRLISDSDNLLRRARYAEWIEGCFIFSLDAALDALDTHVPADPAFTDVQHPGHQRDGWQAKLTIIIRPPHEHAALVHLRRQLDRWT
eukprot:2157331-Pyramimonas_sp.AAC.1